MGQRDKNVLVDDHITCTASRMSVQPMDNVKLADCSSWTWSHHPSAAILVYPDAKTWSPSVSRVQSRKTLYVSCYTEGVVLTARAIVEPPTIDSKTLCYS